MNHLHAISPSPPPSQDLPILKDEQNIKPIKRKMKQTMENLLNVTDENEGKSLIKMEIKCIKRFSFYSPPSH